MPSRFISSLLFALLLSAAPLHAQTSERPTPDWPKAISYEIFVHSFADGSGDGIGDFKGAAEKLDYLEDLGVKSLWLMPIHPSPTYHKYDVTDYWNIHPDYGTMEDFEYFLTEAEARDIRVIIDFVVNHSSNEHPWFQQAIADTTSPYYDFYLFEHADNIEERTVAETGPDTDNIERWNPVEELEDTYFYAYFWSGMPDLNYDNPAVRDSIYAIGEFWLEKGVDGFRLDAARHIYPEEREEENYAFWEEFRAEMEAVNEDVLLVGEVWADTESVKPYLTGLPSLFNFDMAGAMMNAVQQGEGAGLSQQHADIRNAYHEVTDDFVDATFLTNHDQDRVMSVLDDEDQVRLAANLLFTLPGAPYIYYGEEIGMRGMKPDPNIREPMLWTTPPDTLRPTWIDAEYSTDDTVTPVDVQLADSTSLLHHYRDLIALRNAQPALTHGDLQPINEMPEELSVFKRSYGSDEVLVIHNLSAYTIQTPLPRQHHDYRQVLYQSDDEARIQSSLMRLPPRSTLILSQ